MSVLSKRYGTDKDKEENGAWSDFGDGISVRIRRGKSKAAQNGWTSLSKPHLNAIRKGTLAEDVSKELIVKHAALYLVTDWKGVSDDVGVTGTVDPTDDNKIAVFRKYEDFLSEVLEISGGRDAYASDVANDAVGN